MDQNIAMLWVAIYNCYTCKVQIDANVHMYYLEMTTQPLNMIIIHNENVTD